MRSVSGCQATSGREKQHVRFKMPRKYIRKTETEYSMEDLIRAVVAVKSKKLTLGKAAATYSVPKTTLYDHMKKTGIVQPKKGKKAIFSDEQETELEEHIIKCSKLFYGLTIEKLRKIAFTFAEQNKLKHNFNKTTQMAGKDWYYGFLKRHPNISLRKPEATSLNRISAFSEIEVKTFFNNLERLQNSHHFDADHIYNVDETRITNVQRCSKILAPKGQKQVRMATSSERGTLTTIVCAFSASGKYIPPFFIFNRKRMTPQLLRGGNANIIATVSDSGWINEKLFVNWLHHFISFSKPTKENPVLLILDNHESHISLDSFLLCRQHGIILLSLPPHTSHCMQPLNLTYFGPLKSAYKRECDLYMAENTGRGITQYDVIELFTKAYNRVSNIEKGINGFQAAGIFPMNPDKFTDFFTISATETAQRTVNNIETPSDQREVSLDNSIPLSDIVTEPTLPNEIPKKMGEEEDYEYHCIYCNEKYEDPPSVDWIMCYKCDLWAHENCSGGTSTPRGFVCVFCDE